MGHAEDGRWSDPEEHTVLVGARELVEAPPELLEPSSFVKTVQMGEELELGQLRELCDVLLGHALQPIAFDDGIAEDAP